MKLQKTLSIVEITNALPTITWGKGDKLGLRQEPVDDLLRISVTLTLDERTKAVSYKAHSYDIVAFHILDIFQNKPIPLPLSVIPSRVGKK